MWYTGSFSFPRTKRALEQCSDPSKLTSMELVECWPKPVNLELRLHMIVVLPSEMHSPEEP
jgi:hypothetical protein